MLDEFIVMPDHVDGILSIERLTNVGVFGSKTLVDLKQKSKKNKKKFPGLQPKSLGSFVSGFKKSSTYRINRLNKTPGRTIWQRNYYEHIIRDDNELNKIREYIIFNPGLWGTEHDFPENIDLYQGLF